MKFIVISIVVAWVALIVLAEEPGHVSTKPNVAGTMSAGDEVASALAPRDRSIRRKRLLARMLPANERFTVLASLVATAYKDSKDVEQILHIPPTKMSSDQMNWLRGLLNTDMAPWNSSRHDILALLYTVRSLDHTTSKVKEIVLQASDDECDRIWQLRTKKRGPDIAVRESAWTSLIDVIACYGDQDMLTPSFWRTLESQGFRDGGTLALYANTQSLQKLKDIRKKLEEKNEQITAKLDSLIGNMQLAMEYPEVKQVGPMDLRLALHDLSQIPADGRKKWVSERVEKARVQITEERQRLEKELASQPSTLPASRESE